jgi:hypothetical protein
VAKDYIARVVAAGGVVEGQDYLTEQYNKFSKYNPTLLNIPAGYGESTSFSLVPADGSGDLSWTRNSTRQRTNGQGNNEEVPPNLFQQSNTFTNAAWTKSQLNVTPDAIVSPDGNLNASKIAGTTITSAHFMAQSITAINGQTYVASASFKEADAGHYGVVRFQNSSAFVTAGAVIDLSNGQIVSQSLSIPPKVVNLGDGWYRLEIAIQARASGNGEIFVAETINANINSISYLGDGTSGVFVYNATVNEGTEVKESPITTDRLNVPALDNSTGIQRWSVEPQRTNAFTDYDILINGAPFYNPTPDVNEVVARDSFLTGQARRISYSAGATNCTTPMLSTTAGNTYCVKQEAELISGQFQVRLTGNIVNAASNITFDNTGTPVSDPNGQVINSGVYFEGNSPILWFTFQADKTYTGANGVALSGVNQGEAYYGLIQFEQGAYPTSFIETNGSAVTRSSDTSSVNNLVTNGILQSNRGFIYLELDAEEVIRDSSSRLYQVGGANGRVYIYNDGTGEDYPSIFIQNSGGFTAKRLETRYSRIGFNIKETEVDVWVNGALFDTLAGNFSFTSEEMLIQGINRAAFFGVQMMKNTSLTDADATEITGGSLFSSYESMAAALNYIIN